MNINTKSLLYRIGQEIVNKAKTIAPYKSGNLSRDIQVIDISDKDTTIGNTQTAKYAKYIHSGTGLYGKRKRKIVPKKGKALKTPYGYRKSVKGIKPRPYLTNALQEYQSGGGLDRALSDFGQESVKDIGKQIKESFYKGLK